MRSRRLAAFRGRLSGVARARPAARVRTPTILQMEAVECGAACLAIVLARFGLWVPLEELRLACGVSRDGARASNMLRAAQQYGLDVQAFKAEPSALRQFAPPMILHWSFNHFVVLEGFGSGRVYLNDPACGPRTAGERELDESFTGVVLVLRPGKGFVRAGRKPSFLDALHRRLTGSWAAIAFVVLTGCALMGPRLASPLFAKVFVQNILLERHEGWLPGLLLVMGGTAVLLGLLTWLQQRSLLRLETRLAVTGAARLFWHLLRLPVEFFGQRFAGDLSSRVAISGRVAELLSRDLATNVLSALTIAFVAAVMFRYDALLATLALAAAGANVAALFYFSRRRVDGNRRLLLEQGKLSAAMMAGLEMVETVKAGGAESDLCARWAGHQAKIVTVHQGLERNTVLLGAVPPLLAALGATCVLVIGSQKVMHGELTLGELVAFQLLLALFLAPVARLVGLAARLQTAQGDLARIDEVLRYPAEGGLDGGPAGAAKGRSAGRAPRLTGRLQVEQVCFGYNRLAPPLLDGVTVAIAPGERKALVGPSGSGKSTVARLIAGLYQPWSGEIRFDGSLRAELPRALLCRSVGIVDQGSTLFPGTVRENLTLWDPSVPLAEVIAAARDAAIHDDIVARPGGYDSPVEEGGRNWSGGQRQRLEIARALVARPALLVLDEATSALDPAIERRIDENLRRRGCACLIIAHRLSTIRDADEILVLDGGRVLERGIHVELLARDGAYARLIASQ
jgi:NHLM bacteriocin system ABC transporter peptidase/ATP-binding protein